MRELTDIHFPDAARIRVVLDNLSTHFPGSLYQAFPPCEAHRVLRRLEFHYVPKHASWLNMVEIEIGVLRCQCLDRRIATREQLISEIATWQQQRNASAARMKWMFTTEKARAKMGRAYPQPVRGAWTDRGCWHSRPYRWVLQLAWTCALAALTAGRLIIPRQQ